MKTLGMVLTFMLFVFVSPVFSQQQSLGAPVNNWKFNNFNGTLMDSVQTKTVLVDSISAQKYSVWGYTKKNGGWYIAGCWVKPLVDFPYIADTLAIKCRFNKGTSNILEVRVSIGIQDSLDQLFTGYEGQIDLKNLGWQNLKFDMNSYVKTFMKKFKKAYLYFLVISRDSSYSYTGSDIEVKDFWGIDDTLGIIVYDNFAISTTGVKNIPQVQIPNDFKLENAYPNPFNPSTTIRFSIPKTEQVSLKVYNSIGQEVATLLSEEKGQGSYEASFDASKLSSGLYLYRLQAGSYTETKKMIFQK